MWENKKQAKHLGEVTLPQGDHLENQEKII